MQTAAETDIGGRPFSPFTASPQPHVLVFVSSDCPISNGYAPDLQRMCTEYGTKGVRCSLVYEDLDIDAAAVRAHLAEYGYRGVSAAIDGDRTLARRAGASVTPEAVLVDVKGRIRYRGRIDNRYIDLGKQRRIVTERDLRDALDAVLAGKPVPHPETRALGCHIVPRDFERKQP